MACQRLAWPAHKATCHPPADTPAAAAATATAAAAAAAAATTTAAAAVDSRARADVEMRAAVQRKAAEDQSNNAKLSALQDEMAEASTVFWRGAYRAGAYTRPLFRPT